MKENTPMHIYIHREKSRWISTNMLPRVVRAFLLSFLLNYFYFEIILDSQVAKKCSEKFQVPFY